MKERIFTGVLLALSVLISVVFFPTWLFGLLIYGATVIGLGEWVNLLQLKSLRKNYLITGTLLLVIVYFLSVQSSIFLVIISLMIVLAAALLWLAMPAALIGYVRMPKPWMTDQTVLSVLSILMLAGFMVALIRLHSNHYTLVIYLIALVALADSAAYFVGRAVGRHKLAVTISPGKTIEGACGGLFVAFIFSLAWAVISGKSVSIFGFTLVSLITVIISISGDLFESLVKRKAGLKDSGNLLPGHGGILDRIDAHIAAAPVLFIGLYFTGSL